MELPFIGGALGVFLLLLVMSLKGRRGKPLPRPQYDARQKIYSDWHKP
jgi:hypothetical protein